MFLGPCSKEGIVAWRRLARQAPDVLAVGHGRWQSLASQAVQGGYKHVWRGGGDGQVAPGCAGERVLSP